MVPAAAAEGCGLDLPGSGGAAGRSGPFILSGEAGEASARPGATRGGERARGRVRRHIQKRAWAGGWFGA